MVLSGVGSAYQTLEAKPASADWAGPNPAYATSSHCRSSVGINDFSRRGVTTDSVVKYWDVCANGDWLRKYYCHDGNVMGDLVRCQAGCYEGACM